MFQAEGTASAKALRVWPFWGTHGERQLDCSPGAVILGPTFWMRKLSPRVIQDHPAQKPEWPCFRSVPCSNQVLGGDQELEKLGLGDSVDLHVYEIPVEYKTVQRLIPALWEKHSPQQQEVRKHVILCRAQQGCCPLLGLRGPLNPIARPY
uniref:Pyroglutamyl-peptidase 1 isoform X3 n=1 Tax=Camelus bactrianus TaxID=9837 RepID=A0A9W3H948_CAMBA|nr:pyroglutamyl-peptidase 1 isoform X3 [Camelus bactrianus]